MRLGWMSSCIPWPTNFGGALRVHHLIRQATQEHHVDVVCLGDERTVLTPPPGTCHSACALPPDHQRRWAQVRSLFSRHCGFRFESASTAAEAWLAQHASELDAVVLDSTQMGWLRTPPGLPRILSMHNIEHEMQARTALMSDPLRRWYRTRDAKRLCRDEEEAVRAADQVWCCSRREAEQLAAWIPAERITVVPNGVDHEQVKPGGVATDFDGPEVVFVSATHYAPNEDAAYFFATEVWPLIHARHPALRFGIIGGRPSARLLGLSSPSILVRGMVPEVLPYYRNARLAVVPLRAGSGTRLKILEAAAAGVPMVSTTIGAEGLDFVHGRHLLLADGVEALTQACLASLEDATAAATRATTAREAVVAGYSWDAAGTILRAALAQLPTRR